MRHNSLRIICAVATLVTMGGAAGAQLVPPFQQFDWLTHRGTSDRLGSNGGVNPVAPTKMVRRWIWPGTAQLNPEMVVDNSLLPAPMFPVDGVGNPVPWSLSTTPTPPYQRNFGVQPNNGTWVYPVIADRAQSAWPISDATFDKMGDYVYTLAQTDNVIAALAKLDLDPNNAGNEGLEELKKLPNVSSSLERDFTTGKNFYKTVDDELRADTAYARWTFGTVYPDNTFRGTVALASGTALAPNERYAVYIKYPSSGTLIAGQPHPNADWVFVRVSWGDDVNDPRFSRIFMLNFGDTGGFWKRVRSSALEDRYFPYDGVHPLTVTIYSRTISATNEFGISTIVPADAVRLVPERLRGDIHAPAASAAFNPPGSDPNTLPGSLQLTYFGRDETVAPQNVTTLAQAQAESPGDFTVIPFDPTLPPTAQTGANPHIDDPTTSNRSAVFYCFEDKPNPPANFGRMRWRYAVNTKPVAYGLVDDSDPGFTPGLFVPTAAVPADQAFGATFSTTVAVTAPATTAAIWNTTLSTTPTYTVSVWIPNSDPVAQWAHGAHYIMNTVTGTVDIFYDQFAAGRNGGGWHVLASGVQFAGANPQLQLANDSNVPTDVTGGLRVVADAVQFTADDRSSNGVAAAPLIANVTWPSGTQRQVVYFATTGGQVFALDALGVGGTSLNTTVYWAYPSVSNPDPTTFKAGTTAYDMPANDPNVNPDAANNVGTKGIDGDLEKTTVGGATIYTVNQTSKSPSLGAFVSSPTWVEVVQGAVRVPFIVIGNNNGRIYAFDPAGRTNSDAAIGIPGDPFPTTISSAAAMGVPGTTRRTLTWPTIGRDKWLDQGAVIAVNDHWPLQFPDDASKGSFQASIAATQIAPNPPTTDRIIAGAGDGHVYCVDMVTVRTNVRISNALQKGAPRWVFPNTRLALGPITQTGVLTGTDKYVFTAPDQKAGGGRVYCIDDPASNANGVANMLWVFPFTGTPGASPNVAADKLPMETPFTSPAWKTGLAGINGALEVVFIANRDGRVYAFAANTTGGAEPAQLWTDASGTIGPSFSLGPTRSSVVFLNQMNPQARYPSAIGAQPALLLGLDTGDLVAFNAGTGRQMWGFPDGNIGSVPLGVPPPPDGPGGFQQFSTSSVWRGADVITPNNWFYEGDEGNQDTGEMNGQMRAYAEGGLGIGQVTQDEPTIDAEQTNLAVLLANIFNGASDSPPGPFDNFPGVGFVAPAHSPYIDRALIKANTQAGANVLVFEWGDTIKVVAWGAMHYDPTNPSFTGLPTVHFQLTRGQTNEKQSLAVLDNIFTSPPALDMFPGDPGPNRAWVAKTTFPLGRGSDMDAQTPGTSYQIRVYAEFNGPTGRSVSNTLYVGQLDDPALRTPYGPPQHTAEDTNLVGAPRNITLAHPLAFTVRGPFNEQPTPSAVPNIIAWTDGYPIDLVSGNVSELLANGNYLTDPASMARTGIKNMTAPVGMGAHGGSILYQGIDNNGNRAPALFVADRSNLFKLGQPINNVRVERSEMRWGWNPATGTALQQATGNVMNPLPWEDFPINVPNRSIDYPDIDRNRTLFHGNGIDMGTRGVVLPGPDVTTTPGTKILRPLQVELQVDIPRFQPANVNSEYFNIAGTLNPVILPGTLPGLFSPMILATGTDPSNSGNAQLKQQLAPSAGYVGQYYVFIDSNGNGRYDNTSLTTATAQRTVLNNREEVYRQLAAGVAVQPDLTLRTEEETLDLQKQPHSSGYTPTIPFGPSGVGPYSVAPYISPWDTPGSFPFFMPFTVQNNGNVNLVNLRTAKVVGDPSSTTPPFNLNNPAFWLRLTSDQVEPSTGTGQIWGVPFNFLAAQGGAGNIGVVSSLDHQNSATNFEIDYVARYGRPNFWSMANPYVAGGNPLDVAGLGWTNVTQPRPSLHKSLPGDSAGTILSVPDVPHGDPNSYLTALATGSAGVPGRQVKPMIGLTIPLGTPAGTYSAPVYVFEDNMPQQWRDWSNFYKTNISGAAVNQMDLAINDDGVMNIQYAGAQTTPIEAATNPTFKLKVTVQEARITNGVTVGSYNQLDIRAAGAPAFGASLQPAAMIDRTSKNMFMYFASNRPNNFGPAPVTPDTNWYLFFSQLNQVIGNVAPYGPVFDWKYEPISGGLQSWWNPLAANAAYPAPPFVANVRNNFPSEATDIPMGTTAPVVPGIINPNTERHASPALTQDDDPTKNTPLTWLFWQGHVYKSATGGQGFSGDTRTFYAPLQNGVPNPPNGIPYSFLNDPNLPKFSPKPIILTTMAAQTRGYLFWHGGPQGRTRIYANSTTDPTNVTLWTRDLAVPTPGQLQSQSDPYPVHRVVFNTSNQFVDAIDLYYTGLLSGHKQAETLMTRFQIGLNGGLTVMELPKVDNELMVREGATQTWASRDLAWVYQVTLANGDRDLVDAAGVPPYVITLTRANGTIIPRVNLGRPTFDQATSRLYFDSALGGQLYVDPQGGTVTFTAGAPAKTDRLTVTYTPQTMRANVTRNDTGAIFANTANPVPGAWQNDAGFALRPFVSAPGSNAAPVSFIDRSTNPKYLQNLNPQDPNPDVMILPGGGAAPQTARLWLLYRKSDSNVTSTAAVYYKTMRLMVRLPRGVILNVPGGGARRTAVPNVNIAGNRGPVEIDWMRGRLYFTEVDEGNTVTVTFNYGRQANGTPLTLGPVDYRVSWGDEISAAVNPADQTTGETILPSDSTVNEGQVSAFKDPFQDKVWVFWSSTRNGTSDIYYMAINPQFYPIAGL